MHSTSILALFATILISGEVAAYYTTRPWWWRQTTRPWWWRQTTRPWWWRQTTTEPATTDPPCDGAWSEWFDVDSPEMGVGDLETLSVLCQDVCDRPTAIQAQTVDGIPAELTGDVFFSYDIINGFACLNKDQYDEMCEDYEVRFCCPEETPCESWTRWFNTDTPDKYSDRELTSGIRDEHPKEMCENPLFMEAVVAITGQPAATAGQVLLHNHVDPGLVCRNDDQPNGKQCYDYKVRYCCDEIPDKTGECPLLVTGEEGGLGFCYHECRDDGDCIGKKKCCRFGDCGKLCMEPVYPCTYEGVIYYEGDSRKDDCNTCICTDDGSWLCTTLTCLKIPSIL